MDNTDDAKKTATVAGSFPLIQLSRSSSSGSRTRVSPTPPIYETISTGKFSISDADRIAKAVGIYEAERNGDYLSAKNLARLAFIQTKNENNTEYKLELKEVYSSRPGTIPSPEIHQILSIKHTNTGYLSDIHNSLAEIDPSATSICQPLTENSLATVTINITKLAAKQKLGLLLDLIAECAPSIPKSIWIKIKSETECISSSSPSVKPRQLV